MCSAKLLSIISTEVLHNNLDMAFHLNEPSKMFFFLACCAGCPSQNYNAKVVIICLANAILEINKDLKIKIYLLNCY